MMPSPEDENRDKLEQDLAQARLALCLATKTVLANGFKILGISAPEKM